MVDARSCSVNASVIVMWGTGRWWWWLFGGLTVRLPLLAIGDDYVEEEVYGIYVRPERAVSKRKALKAWVGGDYQFVEG